MGVLTQTFGDKLNNFKPTIPSTTQAQITTTSGKQYTLDSNQMDWIKSRYQRDAADTYGWDDADQYAKKTGQLSAKMRNTYKNSNVDRQLAEMGLPSEKNLEKYIAEYQNWHTGGISDYFGKDTPQDFYTKTKEMFKGDWQYDETKEDQMRKSSGQMPTKLAEKYTDTEIDDELRAAGLPPVAEMGKYIGRYNNYSRIDNFYKNASVAWANLGMTQDKNGQYIQNDNKVYTMEDGRQRKGKDLYAEAFYDEMRRTDEKGDYVYGNIFGMFKNNHLEDYDPDDYDGTNYNQYLGKEFVNASKVADLADDYSAYTAFSYDDFAGKYGDYYDKYLKSYKFSDGQTLEEKMKGIAIKNDEQAQREFYDVSDKWFDKGRGTSDFVARYKQMYPNNTYEQMFEDMFENGVAESTIAKTMRTLRSDLSVTGGKNDAEDKNSGYNDITDAFYRAKQNFKSEQRVNEEAIAAEAEELTAEDAVRRIEDYMSESGGWTAENATKAMDALVEAGVDAGTIKDAVADMRARFGDSEYKDAMDALGAYELKEGPEVFDEFTVKKYQKELRAAQRDARKQYAEDEATIQTAYDAIDKMLTNLITTDEGVASVNDVIAVLDSIESASWNNPVSMEKALERYGFVGNGQFTGLAEKLTKNWSNDDKLKLFYNIGSVRTADVDPENNDFIEKFTDIFGGDWLKFNEAPVTKRSMQYADFSSALDWAKEQIANGTLTEAQAYQVLSAEGYSPELEQYVGEDWHRAVYEDLHVPMMLQQAGGAQLAMWEEMTPDERKKMASDMYESLSAEEKAAMFGDADWWKSDPTVYRTFGQAFEQQFAAILPGLATDLIASGAELGDMIGASFTGRPELNDSTKDWMKMQEFVQNYGSVYDDVNGTKVADVAASVVGEIARMQVLGMVGAGVGSAFEATGIGGKVAQLAAGNPGIVKKATGMALSLVRSSPFVANAWAHDYAELKSLGASNSEAMWNSMITGMSEGILEGFNFDSLWGKVLGQEAFATEILDAGKRAFGTAGIVWKARIANMAASGLGEFTEESIGYVLDTYLKMRHSDTWGRGTEWSAKDWLAQAGMGFLVGAIGGGMASMDINASRILSEYAMSSEEGLRAVFPDVFVSDGVWDTVNETVKASYRTGGATVLSDAAYKTLREQAEACVASAQKTLDAARADEADAQEKINNAESEVRKLEDKLAPYMLVKGRKESLTGEEAKEFGTLYAKWNEAKRHAESVRNEVSKDLAEKAGNHERNLQNAESQLKDLQKKIQEHFCGIHLMNEGATPEQAFENMMNAYQNGFKVEGKAAQAVDTKTENAPETNATTETTKDEASVAAREAAYDRVYADQEAGKAYGNETKNAKGRKLTRVEFAENERQNFQAKTTAKQGKVTLELAGLEAAEGMSDKEIIAEAKKAMTPDAAKKLDVYMKLSKALGLPMVIRDVVAGTSGYVHDGKLYVTLNGKQALLRVTAHEVTHWMKEHLPSGYDVLRTRLINDVGGQEAFDELVQKKAQDYGLDLNTEKGRLEADDEVCAELCEKMFENKDALEKFVNESPEAAKTLKARLAKTLVAIKQAIKSLGTSSSKTSGDLIKDQDTIELWYKTLSDAIDAANAEAKGKVQPTIEDVATETETSTEAQPQAPPEADLWSKSYKEWGEADGNSAYAVYLALKEVNPEMAKAYEDGGDGGPQDVLNAVINIANDVRQEQISPMAAATILSNQYNADKSSLGSLFNGAGNATEGVLNAARQIDEERNGAITDLGISAEEVRKQNLRSELEELAKKGTKVKDFDRASVNEILDRVIVGDRTNYSKADYAQIRGMLAQLIPEIKAMVDGDTSVDLDALNERVQTALNYMLDRYSEPSAELYDLREIIPGKIALTETAYNELRNNSEMTLREASNRMTRALGKFVNFVYKGSPNYSAASTIDEVWRDIGYEPEGQGTISEDADALIKYVEERAERSSYDDLYKSQREDMVSAHAGEFLDAVQSMVEGKNANKSEAARYTLDPVDPIEPTSDLWSKTATTAEAKEAFPDLWDVSSEESEDNNPTQRKSTESTYRKIYDILRKEGFSGKILDASSGMGYGTRLGREEYGFDVDDIEPYPGKDYNPMYKDYSALNEKYDAIISSAVLNVLPQDQRDALVVKMGKMLNPGGKMYITTRGTKGDVDNLAKTGKNIQLGPSEFVETVHGSYQKGFTNPELKAYLEDALGPGFTVEVSNKDNGGKFNNNTSIVVTKNDSDVLYALDDDYMPLAEKQKNGTLTEDDARKLSTMVDEAAEAAGYSEVWAHGTPDASFTAFNLSKAKNAKAIFLSDYGTAAQYANTTYRPLQTRLIGKTIDNVDDALAEIRRINDGFNQPKKTEDGWRLPRTRDVLTLNTNGTDADLIDYANKLREKRAGGVYSLYVKEGRKLTVDAKNAWWDRINSEYGRKTDDIARWAQANGYDSVEIDNVHDGGFNDSLAQDVLIVFDPNGVKSTDLVTYDKGNIIPLSERFNPSKTDVRYSIDDDYMPLAERYDAGIATEAQTEELNADVAEAARDAGYDVLAYHGTSSGGFNIFDYSKMRFGLFGEGFYFTEDPDVASSYMNKGHGKTPQVYKVFLRTGNEIDMDAEGNYDQWAKAADVAGFDIFPYVDEIAAEKGSFGNLTNTDYYHALVNAMSDEGIYKYDAGDIVQGVIREMGFDGIRHIGGLRSGNGENLHTVHIVFNSEDIKSAAPVTYDNDGNIIPLSERFDQNKVDTRWSVDDDWDEAVRRYGAKPQGMNPRARDVQVPERLNRQSRLSDFLRSLTESGKVTDDQVNDIKKMVVEQNYMSYIPTSVSERMEQAQKYIAQRQPLQAQQEFHDMVTEGKGGANTVALGIQLLSDAAERGDIESVLDTAADLQILATDSGQSVQAFSVLKQLKGVGSAWYMQKLVDRLNSKYADRIAAGKMDTITVSPELMAQLAAATNVNEIEAAEEAVAKEIAGQLPLTWTDRLSNWRYFSMLANPVTHFRNIFGNVLMGGMNMAKDVVATGLERTLNVAEEDRAHAVLTAEDRKTWGDWAQKSYDENARNLRGGGKLGFETFVKQNMRSFDTKFLNALAKFNFDKLEGEDIRFIRPAYKNALMQYMKAQGYTLNAQGEVGKYAADGTFTPISNAKMTEAEEWASNQAWKATFRDASDLATMLNKVSKMNSVSRLLVEGVMPFKKTPINIAKRGIEYSPAGIVMGVAQLTNGVKKGKYTPAQAIDTLASGLTGSALMALGVFLAKLGVIRGGGEDKKKYETYLEDTGDQTYAFKIGDVSINMSSIAPATIPLFMGVALEEMLNRQGDSFDLSTFTDTIAGTLNPLMEMSFMSSLNSALQNYNNNGIGGALGNTLLTAAQNYGSQYLPTAVARLGQLADPVQRTTKSSATSPIGGNMDYYVRSLAKKVPGATTALEPDVNVWGQTNTKDTFGEWLLDVANKFVLPTNVKITNRDAVDKELIRLVESTGGVDFLPSDGNKYFTVSGQTYKMNARQYTEFSKERGEASYAAIKEVMNSPAYVNANDTQRADMLEKALKAAQKQVNTNWKYKLGAFD